LISKSINAVCQETADPFAGIANGQTDDGRSSGQGLALLDQQDQPRPANQASGQRGGAHHTFEIGAFGWL
jgi:hypothetical protein